MISIQFIFFRKTFEAVLEKKKIVAEGTDLQIQANAPPHLKKMSYKHTHRITEQLSLKGIPGDCVIQPSSPSKAD